MTSHRSRRRNPYRPGAASYARLREATLKRRGALAKTTAGRARTSEARRRARQRASAVQRALRAIERREEFRSKLNERDRRTFFDPLSITQQEQLLSVKQAFPDRVPADVPDPFAGSQRSPSWRLYYYSTRAGMRPRAAA